MSSTGLEEEILGLKESVRFLLKFVPVWATPSGAVPGLDPTMYGTLTYEGDLKVIELVELIRKKVTVGVSNVLVP